MNAGDITFSTALDNSELEKQLNNLDKKIQAQTNKLNQKQAERAPLASQSEQLAADLDAAKARLDYMKSGQEFFPADSITQQEVALKGTQKEWDTVQSKVDRYDTAIANASTELERNKEAAGVMSSELAGAGHSSEIMGAAINRMDKYVERFTRRIKRLTERVLFFSVIMLGLRALRNWFSDVIKSNDAASESVAKLEAALLTLAQPLVDDIIPAFTAFVDVLTSVVTQLANVMSIISGTTLEQSKDSAEALYDETSALNSTGSAAKSATKSLAKFDEINKIGDTSTSITPDFSGIGSDSTSDDSKGKASSLLNVVELISAALLGLKFSTGFVDGIKTIFGLFVAIEGSINLAKNTFDAWVNGISWDNLMGSLASTAELTAGLALAFGKTGAGIGLIVSGLVMLVTGFHDAIENGFNLQNTLESIAGIMEAGIGIGLLAGSWIPMLIAGIASVLLAITVAMGNGDRLIAGLEGIMQGFLDFFKGVFSKNLGLTIQGLQELFNGLKEFVFSIFDSLIQFLGPHFSNTIQLLRDLIGAAIDYTKDVLTSLIKFISGVFTGDWEQIWKGLVNIPIAIFNLVTSSVESLANFFIRMINNLIDGINGLLSVIGEVSGTSLKIPEIAQLSLPSIPALAMGAVIPPNREFAAVLGDQKSGTNIETPEDLLRQIVREESGGGNSYILEQILSAVRAGKILELDRLQLGRAVVDVYTQETRRTGVSLVER